MGWVRAAVAVVPLTLILLISIPADFILGRGPYWDYVISDRAQALTGYLYFVQNSWTQPLLFIPNLSIPQGDYLINADSIVLLALIGRTIHSLSGAIVIPLVLGLLWGRFFVAGAITGVALAVLLHVTVVLVLLTALYQALEWLARVSVRLFALLGGVVVLAAIAVLILR